MAWIVNRLNAQLSDFNHLVVFDESVVSLVDQHRCIKFGHCNVIASFAHRRNRLNVIEVAVSFKYSRHTEPFAHL